MEISNIPITGTEFNYYHICKRKLWLFSHDIQMEQESDNVFKFVNDLNGVRQILHYDVIDGQYGCEASYSVSYDNSFVTVINKASSYSLYLVFYWLDMRVPHLQPHPFRIRDSDAL